MLPPVLLMHGVDSSHSELHSGGLVKLPSNYFLFEIFETSLFYEHFFFSRWVPLQAPLYGAPSQGSLPGFWVGRVAKGHRAELCSGAGWAGWLAFGSAKAFGLIWLGFRLDF